MSDTPPQRLIGGLWCGDVLEALPDYVDGTLPAAVRAQAEAHLAGCQWCAQFGGRYAGLVQRLQGALGQPADVAPEVGERLDAHIDALLGGG